MRLSKDKIFGSVKKFLPPLGENPRIDWSVLLVLFVVINIFTFLLSGLLLKSLSGNDISESERKTVPTFVSKEKLERILDAYEEKSIEFEKAKTGASGVIDPAL